MKRYAIGILLVLHGAAHAASGVWAADRIAPWLLTPLWLVAMVGFMAGGFGLLGVATLRRHWRNAVLLASLASIALLAISRHPASVLGMILDLVLFALALENGVAVVARPAPRAPARLARVGGLVAGVCLAYVVGVLLVRPSYQTWGSTPDERAAVLLGDSFVSDVSSRVNHAITIQAPSDSVWPWLVQIGQDRGGFYSYESLEHLVGADIHNADRIVPEWQRLEEGDLVRGVQPDYLGGILGRDLGWRVAGLEPGRALVLEGWGTFALHPVDSATTRLIVRTYTGGTTRIGGFLAAPVQLLVFEPAHFIMQRRMMLGIKERAERTSS